MIKVGQMVHPANGSGITTAGTTGKIRLIWPPNATPNPISNKISTAPINLAVPETRFRVASSVIAVVKVSPGRKMIKPDRVVI